MIKKLLPTFDVNILADESDVFPQQRLVLEQQYFALNELCRANEHLDTKALGLLQASGLIFMLIGDLKFPALFFNDPGFWPLAGIGLGFLAFTAMIGLAVWSWSPANFPTPGSRDWDEIYDTSITVEADHSFDQILANCLEAYRLNRTINRQKSWLVRLSLGLFLVQIVGLLILAFTA